MITDEVADRETRDATDEIHRAPNETAPARSSDLRRVLVRVAQQAAIAAAFIAIAVLLRGGYLSDVTFVNPDEAELIAQARAALHSPVPFTTWTTATTGPFWVELLALLGVLGLPLTIAFAHLLAAVFLGIIGYLTFRLVRRAMNTALSLLVTAFCWLPVVLTLTGGPGEFGGLSTELLPVALILAAALIRPETLARRPVLHLVSGVLCGLAIGAKYQVAPLALALMVLQLVRIGDARPRRLVRDVALWGAGVVLPFIPVVVAMLVDPAVSHPAIRINLNFLSYYGGQFTLDERIAAWRGIVAQVNVMLLVLVTCWLAARSTRAIQLCRAVVILGGLVAIFIGGQPFPHYRYFLYAALVLAIGLPLRAGERALPATWRPVLAAGTVLSLAVVGWLASFGTGSGSYNLAGRHDVGTALSASSVPRDPRLLAQCPAGSNVLVWGWASELYVDYSWHNAIPFINVTQITDSPQNYSRGLRMVRQAVEDPSTSCVVDAVGSPFFALSAKDSITNQYPQLAPVLDTQYRVAGPVVDCSDCTVYVRR